MRLAIALVGVFFIFGANAMAKANQATLAQDAEELEKKKDAKYLKELGPESLSPKTRQWIRESNRDTLLKEAKKEGIQGVELAALMGQAQHESKDFLTLIEDGKGKGKSYSGGGENFYGRGVFQLTHDYNYKEYGELPEIRQYLDDKYGPDFKLENRPDQLEQDPELSAKVAIAYWKKVVRPAVEKNANGDFGDTQVISAAINRPAANTLDPARSVKKTNKAYEDFAKNRSLESLLAIEEAHNQSEQNRVKGTEDRFNKTREWAERLGIDPSKVFDKPIIEKEKFQKKIKLPPVPPVPPENIPAPTSTTPAEQTGAYLSPEDEEDGVRLKRLKQLYV